MIHSANELLLLDSSGQEILLTATLTNVTRSSAGIYITEAVLPEQVNSIAISKYISSDIYSGSLKIACLFLC